MVATREKPKPVVVPEYCKGCGRCISACAQHSITMGTEINPLTGLIPISIDLESCTGCGLCFSACPEPYGLTTAPNEDQLLAHAKPAVPRPPEPMAEDIPDVHLPLPESRALVIKGNYASAVGALLAGCRHFYGYPITPSTEGAELMAQLLPELNGFFVQAVSEVATINLMYGCGGAGLRSMTFTSSPGFSLMLEGISYMVGSEVPGVIVNVMRGGPGLGNIAPEQSDIKLACRGLGHGNTFGIVLAPSTPQEMLDLTILAFELAFKYRNPVVILADGYLGQMTGRVMLPKTMVKPGLPRWAVSGDRAHRRNLISSIYLSEPDLEAHNLHLNEKYRRMIEAEQRADLFYCDDAEIILVAANTPARMAKGAVEALRQQGVKAGLFRPLTLWPFPIRLLKPHLEHAQQLIVVEASPGQLEDELRLALSKADIARSVPIESVQRLGGFLPQQTDIVEKALAVSERLEGVRA